MIWMVVMVLALETFSSFPLTLNSVCRLGLIIHFVASHSCSRVDIPHKSKAATGARPFQNQFENKRKQINSQYQMTVQQLTQLNSRNKVQTGKHKSGRRSYRFQTEFRKFSITQFQMDSPRNRIFIENIHWPQHIFYEIIGRINRSKQLYPTEIVMSIRKKRETTEMKMQLFNG